MKIVLTFLTILCICTTSFAESFTFYIDMHCEPCATAIQKALTQNHPNQFSNFHADIPNDVVTLQSDTLSREQMVKTIEEKAHYKVSPEPITKK